MNKSDEKPTKDPKDKKTVDTEEKKELPITKEEAKPILFKPLDVMTDIDRWFNRMWRGFDDFFYRPYRLIDMPSLRVPAMDIVENKDKYEITAEIPGLTKDEVEINLKKDILEIKAEHKEEKEVKDGNYIRKERGRTVFYRKIPVPNNVNRDGIEASLNNGVMNLVLPKSESSVDETTKINIK